jgi:PAS domain S-box-containing protein
MMFAGPAGSLKRQQASQVAGFVAITIAAMALIGWWAALPMLSSWGVGFAPTKPVTALCLIALGLALAQPGRNMRVAYASGLAVAAVAAPDLVLDLFGVDLGIDHWLVPRAAVPGPETASLTNITPMALTLAGGSLALSRFDRHHLAAAALGGLAGTLAVFAVFGYLSGIYTLYGPASVNAPSLPTAVGLLCVVGAIFLRTGAMPALRKPRPLWHLQAMLGCAIIVPLLLYCAYAGFRIADAQLRHDLEDLTIETRALSAAVDREIIGEIERLQALAASPSLRQGDFAEFQRQAEAALALRQSGNIMLIDRNMQQLVNTWVPFGTPLPKTAVPETVEKALATGKPQVTGLFTGVVIKQPIYGIVVPVQIDGENRYALFRSPDQRALERIVAANELPPGRQAAVSDAAHGIIVRSGEQNVVMGMKLPPAQWRRAGFGGVFEFIDAEGQPSLQASEWSKLTNWETSIWAPKAVLDAPLTALWRTLGGVTLLALALVVGLALWLGRLIAGSIGHAARTATKWGEGGPLSVNGTPVAEVNTLMAELRETAAKRRAAEERLQLALNAAQLGWWQYDLPHRIVSGDTRFKQIFDVADHETTVDEIVKRVHPDDVDRVRAALEAALDPADPKPLALMYRIQRGDGALRWLETHGLSDFDDVVGRERRAIRIVGTVADITERKENEEKADLLTREISHRAKNIFSVVEAIAHQVAARHPEDFRQRFSDRIQALAANQDLLIRNEWKGVDIKDLVHAQLAHFADLIGSRIAVEGPNLRLTGASAQAIGLALHELATNAGKYGALSTGTGRVDVYWGCDHDVLTMSWTERDGPPVSQPKRRGFGTIVIEAMAARSVGGDVDLDYAPSGVRWRLTCPMANVLETQSIT